MRVWKPWRCLCLGFVLQMTITFFPRLTTLQSLHNRLTDDRTFIVTHQPAHRTTPIKASGGGGNWGSAQASSLCQLIIKQFRIWPNLAQPQRSGEMRNACVSREAARHPHILTCSQLPPAVCARVELHPGCRTVPVIMRVKVGVAVLFALAVYTVMLSKCLECCSHLFTSRCALERMPLSPPPSGRDGLTCY